MWTRKPTEGKAALEAPENNILTEIEELVRKCMDMEIQQFHITPQDQAAFVRAIPQQRIDIAFFVPPKIVLATSSVHNYLDLSFNKILKVWGVDHTYTGIRGVPHLVVKANLIYMGSLQSLRDDLHSFVRGKFDSNFDETLTRVLDESDDSKI